MYIISRHVYTHISKTLVLVKLYLFLNIKQNKKSMANTVGYHNHMCIKPKTGQFNRQFIHVGNWAKKSSIIQPSALCSFFTWLLPGEKITFNFANSNYSCWGHFLNQYWVEKLLTTLPYDEWWITLSWVSIAILFELESQLTKQ